MEMFNPTRFGVEISVDRSWIEFVPFLLSEVPLLDLLIVLWEQKLEGLQCLIYEFRIVYLAAQLSFSYCRGQDTQEPPYLLFTRLMAAQKGCMGKYQYFGVVVSHEEVVRQIVRPRYLYACDPFELKGVNTFGKLYRIIEVMCRCKMTVNASF